MHSKVTLGEYTFSSVTYNKLIVSFGIYGFGQESIGIRIKIKKKLKKL